MTNHTLDNTNDSLDELAAKVFPGRVVRKDLTKLIKEGANVPVFVLEYLLGMYCADSDPKVVAEGVERVKGILADNYVRPDESEKVKSKIREKGEYKIIDKVTAKLNEKKDVYEAAFSNLGLTGVEVNSGVIKQHEKLLVGGIWCIVTLSYFYDEESKSSPFVIKELKPIQMSNVDFEEYAAGRDKFTEDQWIDLLIRSIGIEPTTIEARTKWHLLARMVPLAEARVNLVELGPRSTGKSHIYKEFSPNSILVSGGQTSIANLFYNLSTRRVGLVGLWDTVAFDEVAGIDLKDPGSVQIMKDYMASGSFVRGREQIEANASMVFLGNINESVEMLVKTSHLFAPFPIDMIDTAFLDRFHCYIPGWEVPKFSPNNFTNRYGFIVDYLAETLRELRKRNYSDAIDRYFQLGKDINQRDSMGIRRMTSGLLKLLYPNGQYDKEAVERCLRYALECRRRVKEQLKKLGGMEFYAVHFSYIDSETMAETFVSLPEQGGGKLIPEGPLSPGHLHTVARAGNANLALYRIETQRITGGGKFNTSGLGSSSSAKESVRVGSEYFKANVKNVSTTLHAGEYDFHVHIVDLQGSGPTQDLSLVTFISLCSVLLGKSVQDQMVILGQMSLGGAVEKVTNLADCLQSAHDAGAKRVLLPMSSAGDLQNVPPELFSTFQTSFYSSPVDAVFKALGVV